ncbi:general secretion pathway protein GspA [Psychromonas sp. B3M02]|uniref:AAA family ATPase n=1 Tax=Psychromonas sp. B3M02 TaxID=2267226 RepID=UPI000DEA76C9|nr:ExeA family protein [Psychromonas sp. B3M02]RBW42812.1 general secretion pathway protein GspA [Psychromonas sp. B3M02]
MYQEFFSLKEQPFSISPDPDFLFLSDRHKEALAHLMYGLQGNGGFVLLTGEVGTGKTTVCRALLQDMSAQTDIAFVLNPAQTEVELLATICDQFKIDYDQQRTSLKSLFDAISGWMLHNLEKGRSAIVLIDEAQHLSFAVLEQLRLLTNIESDNKKPLQVILIGQTELQQKLKENQLRQLAQRITARYHLLPLTLQETEYYIQHRLNVAGASYPIFETKLLKRIFKYSRGIPRLINLICDRSLLCAFSQNSPKVNASMVDLAVKEIDLSLDHDTGNNLFKYLWRVLFLVILVAITVYQAPKIWHHLMQPEQALETVSEMHLNVIPEVAEPIQQPVAITPPVLPPTSINNQLSWFNNYPTLNLSQGEYDTAVQTLFAVWGYQVASGKANCEQASRGSLLCFSSNTSLQKLTTLNYPAVIELASDEDIVYAVLYRVEDQFELLIGSQQITVDREWLDEYWSGEFTLLWQPPFTIDKPLKFGEKSGRVLWLTAQLNRLYGLPETQKDRFDWELKEQVTAFQEDNGLVADGIAGQQTLMLLAQQLDPKIPSLL